MQAEEIEWEKYEDESQLDEVMKLVGADLSEPYSLFTYRYFVRNWPELCLLAKMKKKLIGVAISKIEENQSGYVAILAVQAQYRRFGIATHLIKKTIQILKERNCSSVYLEAEISNQAALQFYHKLGFIRSIRLSRYYFNGSDAFRLVLHL